jgi:hypothetical protein
MDQLMRAGTETSAIIPEVWSADFFEVLLAELPFNSIIATDYENEISDLGDTVNVASIPEFDEGTELAEDERADAAALTITSQQLIINKRIVKDFIVTKLALIQSQPVMDQLKQMAIYAVLKKMQSIIIAAIVPSASAPDHTIAYDTGTTAALADLLEVKELLDTANVPMGDRHSVFGAAQTNDIFNITGFTSSDFLTAGQSGVLSSGELPSQLLGFRPHMTTVVGNTSYHFHRTFMQMAVQQGMSVAEFDLGADGKRATRVNVDVLFGLKQMDSKRVVTLS